MGKRCAGIVRVQDRTTFLARDALVDAVNAFDGGVVLVSHDQFFVNAVCTEAWVVNNGKVKKAAAFQAYVERQVRKLEG